MDLATWHPYYTTVDYPSYQSTSELGTSNLSPFTTQFVTSIRPPPLEMRLAVVQSSPGSNLLISRCIRHSLSAGSMAGVCSRSCCLPCHSTLALLSQPDRPLVVASPSSSYRHLLLPVSVPSSSVLSPSLPVSRSHNEPPLSPHRDPFCLAFRTPGRLRPVPAVNGHQKVPSPLPLAQIGPNRDHLDLKHQPWSSSFNPPKSKSWA